jgi:hypothetical protein
MAIFLLNHSITACFGRLFSFSLSFNSFKISKSTLLCLLLLGWVGSASGATNTWTGATNNNWSTKSNWSSNAVPNNTDDIIINKNTSLNVDVSSTINSLTISNNATVTFTSSGGGGKTITIDNTGSFISSGSSLTLKGSTGSGTRFMSIVFTGTNETMSIAGTLTLTNVGGGTIYNATNSLTTVSGSIINDGSGTGTVGTITSTTSNLLFLSGGKYNHALDGGIIPTATWDPVSTCTVIGMVGNSPSGLAQTFGNLIWNCSGQTGNVATSGNITVNGNFTLNSGTFALNNALNYTLTIAGNYTQTGGVFDFNYGTSGNSYVYLSGYFSNTAGAGSITTSGAGAPNGFFIFNGSGVQTLNMPISGAAIWVMYTINSGSQVQLLTNLTLYGANQTNFYGQMTVNGTLNVGTYTISDGSSSNGATAFTLNSGSTFISANSGGIDGSISTTNITRTFSTGANYIYNGTVPQITSTGMPSTINNLTISNSGSTVTLSAATTINGNLLISSGTLSTSASNYNLTVGGNWINNGGTFTPGSSTVTFTGNNSAINGSAATQSFNNIIVNKTAGQTLSVGGSTTTLNIGGTFTETQGNFTAPATMTVTGDITLTSGTFTAGTALTASGNWYNNGATFTAGGGTVTMNGSSTKIIGGTTSTTFNNLTLGTGGGQAYSLGYSQTVIGTLNLQNNTMLAIGSNNLTLGTLATCTGSFGNNCRILADQSGQVRKLIAGNGSFTFPIGDVGANNYSPITLNFTSGTYAIGAYVALNVKNVKHPQNLSPTNYLKRYWTISQSGITSFLCSVTGNYVNNDINGTEIYQTAAEYTGLLPWIGYSALGSNTLTAGGVTAFGDFTGMGLAQFSTPTSTLTGFTYAQGSGPSASQSFYLTGSNLSDNIIVTAPSDFEVCLSSGGTYVQSLPVTQSGGVVTNVPVYVRLKAGLNAANYTGETLTCTATGAKTVNLTVSGTVTPTTYCASYGDGSAYGITLVNFNTLNNSTIKSASYTDYTSQSTNILVGSTYPLSVNIITSGTDRVYAKVWIDWNNNGNFNDAGESYDLGSTTTNGKTSLCPLNITVPAGATLGSTRMRVSCNFYNAVNTSCDNGLHGEVEDYTLNIYNPVITASTTALNGFSYTVGSGPSTEQSFTISGTGIFDAVTVTPPTTNFEISTVSGGVFQTTPITISKDLNNKVTGTVYVRLIAGLSAGSYGPQNISLTSTYATVQNIACNGVVVPGITVGGGGSYCSGSPITLTSSSGINCTNIYWEGPNNFLATGTNTDISKPFNFNATVNPPVAGTYKATASFVNGGNLVANGNFSGGMTGYGGTSGFNSDYIPVNPLGGNQVLYPEGTYTVVANPNSVHDQFGSWPDHTSGSGLQMVINGSITANKNIWYETVPVTQNTNYQFTYWVQSLAASGNDAAPSQLQLYVTGNVSPRTAAGPVYTAIPAGGQWEQFVYNWNSGTNISATISLVNQQTAPGGNDFALDDLVFQPVYSSSASVNVTVIASSSPASVSVSASANPVFSGTNVTFTATPTNGGTGPAYQWSVNGTNVGTNSTVYTYTPSYGDVVSCSMTSNSTCLSGSNPVNASLSMNVITVLNYWLGINGTNWGTASNWTRGAVPGTGDNVAFATTATYGSNAVNNLVLDGDKTIGNLTNLSPVSLVIPPAKCLTVNGTIITNGASSPGSIYLQADHTGTEQNGSFIFSNASPVYATVEMYSKAFCNSPATKTDYKWQYFGIPVSTITASPVFDGSYVRSWDETAVQAIHWVSLNNSSPLTPFIGYEITQTAAKTLVFTGQLVNWDSPTEQLSYTTGSGTRFPGQNIYANPYTAAVDISQLQFGSTDQLVIDNTVYLYSTGSLNDWTSVGGVTVTAGDNAGLGQYTAVPINLAHAGLGLPGQVPSMQAMLIWSHKINAAATFKIPYSAVIKNTALQRVPGNKTDTFPGGKTGTMIEVKGSRSSDKMWLFTQPGCTRNFDNGWDGAKLMGEALTTQLFAIEQDGYYQVDAVEDINNTLLGFQAGENSGYTLTFTHQNFASNYAGLFLVDLVENKTTDITKSGSTYSFVAEPAPAPVKRFLIASRNIKNDIVDATTQLNVFNSGNRIFIQNSGNLNGKLEIYDLMGRNLKTASFGPSSVTSVQLETITGAYIINAATEKERITKKIIL